MNRLDGIRSFFRVSASFLVLILVSACSTPTQSPTTISVSTVTVDANSTLTQTPFQPAIDTPTHTLTPTQTFTSSPTLTPLPPTRIPASDKQRANYIFQVELDYSNHFLVVREDIIYPNLTGGELGSLLLAVEASRWRGAFILNELIIDDQISNDYALGGGWLEISLDKPLAYGDTISIQLNYQLNLPWNGAERVFGYNNWHMNVVDWYPYIVPYIPGSGWLAYDPAYAGEHLSMDSADFEVTIRDTNGLEGLQIAASSPAETSGDGLHFRLEAARNFVFSVSTSYSTTTDSVDGITVTSYYANGHQTAGEAILNAAIKAIQAYNQLFAPYPHQSISIVETYYPDGLEFDGLVFLSRNFYEEYDGSMLNNLLMIGIHEISHLWWFGLVGNDQAKEPWLDETLATYSERLFYEKINPGLVGYWWNFRVNDFQPLGKIDVSIYQGGSFRPYTNAVYLRGARFMENLRTRIGDDAFFAFLKDYASQMSYQIATADDFFRILYSHSQVDIRDIITEYFQVSH